MYLKKHFSNKKKLIRRWFRKIFLQYHKPILAFEFLFLSVCFSRKVLGKYPKAQVTRRVYSRVSEISLLLLCIYLFWFGFDYELPKFRFFRSGVFSPFVNTHPDLSARAIWVSQDGIKKERKKEAGTSLVVQWLG